MKKTQKALIVPALLTMLTSFAANPDTNIGSKPSASAKSTAPAPTLVPMSESAKIRYIDPYKIIPKLEQWNDERIKIQKELEARTRQIEDLKVAYTTKANQIQSMGNVVKDKAKEDAREEMMKLENSIQIKQQSFQEYAERASQEAQMVIFREIETIAKDYALENGIDFILAGGAIYVNDKFDISDAIADRMNARYAAQKKNEATAQKTASANK